MLHAARLSASLTAMALALLVATGARAADQQPVTTFDGSYTGMPVAERMNRTPPCAKPQVAVLDVQNGAARMRSSIDRRKGQVKPDGTLTMRGELVISWQHIPGFIEGRFTKDRFEGVSRFPSVNCAYRWSLQRTH